MCYSNGVINLDKHCDSEGGKIRLIPGPPGPKGYSADLSTVLLLDGSQKMGSLSYTRF